jgi:hypothetical protein
VEFFTEVEDICCDGGKVVGQGYEPGFLICVGLGEEAGAEGGGGLALQSDTEEVAVLIDRFAEGELGGGAVGSAGVWAGVEEEGGGGEAI